MRSARIQLIGNCDKNGSSGGNDSKTICIPFTFLSSSPLALTNLVIGDFIKDVYIQIKNAFPNGTTLQVGVAGNNGELMDSGDNKPNKSDSIWHVVPFRESVIVETLNLYIGGSPTFGDGLVKVEFGET